jgi:DNA-binding LytR/AlgR family response regulator
MWTVGLLTTAVANSVVAWMEVQRGNGMRHEWWEPLTWEFSSTLALLVLLPPLILFEARFSFRWDSWRRVLPWHLLAVVVFSVAHVLIMVGLRHLVYAAAGAAYDFGHWPRQLVYEFMKDWRTYSIFLLLIYFYRLLLLRLQGEARLLAAPDTGSPVEEIERPERFLVRKLGSEFLVAARDIEWLEAAENYVNLHVRGRVYPLRSTMAAIQERLDPRRFVRVHRSHIVNLDFLEQIEPLDTGDARLLLKDGSRVPCSRRYRGALRSSSL